MHFYLQMYKPLANYLLHSKRQEFSEEHFTTVLITHKVSAATLVEQSQP